MYNIDIQRQDVEIVLGQISDAYYQRFQMNTVYEEGGCNIENVSCDKGKKE